MAEKKYALAHFYGYGHISSGVSGGYQSGTDVNDAFGETWFVAPPFPASYSSQFVCLKIDQGYGRHSTSTHVPLFLVCEDGVWRDYLTGEMVDCNYKLESPCKMLACVKSYMRECQPKQFADALKEFSTFELDEICRQFRILHKNATQWYQNYLDTQERFVQEALDENEQAEMELGTRYNPSAVVSSGGCLGQVVLMLGVVLLSIVMPIALLL